ncbi:SDR family NAD(P)-dependent oxidoreductase [Acuticoccus yangtzensis]|uniref:SDR family NAD(P)-dependent oxidoreductase n=1 Tax=Acuticoccus yangtzensis TaxID=1443441 RepID=UPI000949963E|nr:SDR family oxidoreductase [Acuticoccus yangtzensis]
MSVWPTDCFTGAEVLVVGATSGIGAAIAAGFRAAGANVTVTGATPAEVEAASAAMEGVRVLQLDVRDKSAVDALVGGFARLDHLVNCAGIIRRGDELAPDVFADVVDINLTGSMRTAAAARPLLAASGGTITNTASMLTYFGGALVPAYSASKGGIGQLTKSLALAYAADGIRVNAIAPGWIATPLTKALREDPVRNEAIMGRTALKRWGEPSDLAGAVLFLASPMAAYITGTILPVDGGYLCA